jgi:hypothetical protein
MQGDMEPRGLHQTLSDHPAWFGEKGQKEACLILRNSAEVVRRHYIRLEQEGTKVDAMARLEQAYEKCAASVQ